MKTNTRYILTATGVAAGLFLVGATANALATDNTATTAPIGAAVVLPSASSNPSATPSLVEVEYAENTDPSITPIPDPVVDTGGWGTAPAGAGGVGDDVGDDDGHEEDDELGASPLGGIGALGLTTLGPRAPVVVAASVRVARPPAR